MILELFFNIIVTTSMVHCAPSHVGTCLRLGGMRFPTCSFLCWMEHQPNLWVASFQQSTRTVIGDKNVESEVQSKVESEVMSSRPAEFIYPDDPLKTTDQTRRLGLIVCRGTAVMLVSPTDGTDEIANPFIQPDGA
uniref:U6 snRNA-associated Sm-like protein LSm7 n=1 Tax=Quercus lobata TaxID=97700 RepID=A0A7N2KTN1_QUELO